jgi:hypothetical protein
MKKTWLGLLLSVGGICILVGCAKEESFSTGDDSKWNDPNFKIITVGTYNYTDDAIFGVFILPVDKNDIDFAGTTGVGYPVPKNATRWESSGGNSPALAWDVRWKPPQKFKIWWERVFDPALYKKSSQYPKDGGMFDPFDPYITKQTRPGSAWCEYEIEVKEKFNELHGVMPYPNMRRDKLMLYFFPDGTIKGHLEFPADAEVPFEGRVDIALRDQLPRLKDKVCLKEIPNPFYGKRKPTIMN